MCHRKTGNRWWRWEFIWTLSVSHPDVVIDPTTKSRTPVNHIYALHLIVTISDNLYFFRILCDNARTWFVCYHGKDATDKKLFRGKPWRFMCNIFVLERILNIFEMNFRVWLLVMLFMHKWWAKVQLDYYWRYSAIVMIVRGLCLI